MPSPTLEYAEENHEEEPPLLDKPQKPQVQFSKFNKVNLQLALSSDEDNVEAEGDKPPNVINSEIQHV